MPDSWFFRPQPRPNAAWRLFCFPHAGGGGVAFRDWAASLSPAVDLWAVRLPGRESRLRERAFTAWPELLDALLPALRPQLDRPFALFGHSLGALVAFEVAQALRFQGDRLPDLLVVSSQRAPDQPDRQQPALHLLPEPLLVARLAALGGIPTPILQNRELMAFLLPLLRADLTLAGTYAYETRPSLTQPILAVHGQLDRMVNQAEMAAWQGHTAAGFSLEVMAGGHFHWHSDPSPLLTLIEAAWQHD